MSRKEMYEQRTEELLLPILERCQFELVDVEYVKEGGITVDDCELVSRQMSDLLDEQDFIEESYIFEVSSPGLGRPLKKEKDFARNLGKEVEIRTYRAIGKEKEFYGILKSYDGTTVTIEADNQEELAFARADIALIRLAFDF